MRNKNVIEEDRNTCKRDYSRDYNNKIEDNISNINIKSFFDNKI